MCLHIYFALNPAITMNSLKIIFLGSILIFLSNKNLLAQTTQQKDSLCLHAKAGMTLDEFNQLLQTDKYVLADFYADWCAPCKKLEPVILEIAKERADVIVIRINQDTNKPLFDALKVYELPTLLIYKNKIIQWTGEGVFPKEMIEAEFK